MTRRGMTLLEVSVAGLLLAGMLTFCLQVLHTAGTQHRATEMRQTAIREAGNVMERLGAVAWDDLTQQAAAKVLLSDEAAYELPGGELEIDVSAAAGDPDAKRIAVQIRWQDRTGQVGRPVQLVAWRYRPIHAAKEGP